MERKIQHREAITLLYKTNRLNVAQITNIQTQLYPLINQHNKEIILDLRHVLFMDCSAVGCIISMNRIAQANHTNLTLVNLMRNVQLLADALKLSQIINIGKKENNNIQNTIVNDTQIVKCTHLF